MNRTLKLQLLIYLIVSAFSFTFFILPRRAGVSVLLFTAIQLVFVYILLPKKRHAFVYIPVLILAANSFISTNGMWHFTNFIISIGLMCVMILLSVGDFPVFDTSLNFLRNIFICAFKPFKYIAEPFIWVFKADKKLFKKSLRAMTGLVIAIPFVLFLVVMLSSADQIFYQNLIGITKWTFDFLSIIGYLKLLFGFIAGFYLFGLLYEAHQPRERTVYDNKTITGDTVILSVLISVIVAVYTLFAAIQIRYLFAAASSLPYGLTYTEYARRGFFELLILTGFNILLIYITVHLTKNKTGTGAGLIKGLCCYLCLMTVMLLCSSFYRMLLYSADNGLTRLRFMVFGFLMFELLGLAVTFIYIIKPKFNIAAIYMGIGLVYYLLLNIVPMDALIAKNQIDRYLNTGSGGIEYVLRLSPDAAPQISRLLSSDDEGIKRQVHEYFERVSFNDYGWIQWNLSADEYRAQAQKAGIKK